MTDCSVSRGMNVGNHSFFQAVLETRINCFEMSGLCMAAIHVRFWHFSSKDVLWNNDVTSPSITIDYIAPRWIVYSVWFYPMWGGFCRGTNYDKELLFVQCLRNLWRQLLSSTHSFWIKPGVDADGHSEWSKYWFDVLRRRSCLGIFYFPSNSRASLLIRLPQRWKHNKRTPAVHPIFQKRTRNHRKILAELTYSDTAVASVGSGQ